MKTRFAFGKESIEVSVPDGFDYEVVRSRAARALDDAAGALAAALDSPIGCEPLAKLAAGKRTAAIAVCDITRPAPNRATLPPLLTRLHQAGIPVEGVTILIATGLHRGATKEELDVIRRTGDCGEVSRGQPRCTQLCGASRAGDNEARDAGLYRRAVYGGGSAHHTWICGAAPDAGL